MELSSLPLASVLTRLISRNPPASDRRRNLIITDIEAPDVCGWVPPLV